MSNLFGAAPLQPEQRMVEIPQYPTEVTNEASRLLGWVLSVQPPDPGIITLGGAPTAIKRMANGLLQRADEDTVRTWLVTCQLVMQIAYMNGIIMQMQQQEGGENHGEERSHVRPNGSGENHSS